MKKSRPFEMDEYWKNLPLLELSAKKFNEKLSDWYQLTEKTFQLALAVPFLKNYNKTQSINISIAFFKRCMTDFRSSFLLCDAGYPYQSACVAASLYENSRVTCCLSYSQELAQTFLSSSKPDIPWGPKDLSKMWVQSASGDKVGKPYPKTKEFEENWRCDYLRYKHLCKMKHPTLYHLNDEVKHTAIPDLDQFAPIPIPDNREEALGLKQYLLFCINQDLQIASSALVEAIFVKGVTGVTDESNEWESKYGELKGTIMNLLNQSKISDISFKLSLDEL